MGAGLDTNGRRAQSWKNADVSKIAAVKASRSKKDLLSSIKKVVSIYANAVQGDKDDTKYRSIIDLVMLRVGSELDNFSYANQIQLDSGAIADSVQKSIEDTTSVVYQTSSKMSLPEFVDAVLNGIKEFTVVEQVGNASTEETVEQQEDTHQTHRQTSTLDANEEEKKSYSASAELNGAKKEDLNSIQLNIDKQFNKLFDLCSMSSAPVFSTVGPQSKAGIGQKTPIENQTSALKKLEQKQVGPAVKAKEQKIPSEIAQNNIYKYNKKMFEGLRLPGVVLALNVINVVQSSASATSRAFMLLPTSLADSIKNALAMSKKIYKAVHKSLLQRIIDYFKNKLFKRLLKPLKDKLVDLIKGMVPKWMNSMLDIVKSFLNAAKSMLKLILKGIRRVASWLMRAIKSTVSWFNKVFGGVMKMIKTTISSIFKVLSNALKLAAKALVAIVKCIGKGIKYIGKLFKSSNIRKLFSKFGSKIKKVFGKVKGGIKNLGSKMKNLFLKSKTFIKKMLAKANNAIKNAAQKIVKAIKTVVKKVLKKVFDVVKNTTKKIVQKIMKKLGITIAKKIAKKKAKSLLMMGAKKILGFFKKWVVKFIAKLAAKILGAAAVNAIPILGQIISVCMMIYTIVDTIITFYDVYKFMKENPAAWDYMKEKVAEWASKAFDFGKKLMEWGKKLFIAVYIEGPKAFAKGAAHLLNFMANPFSAAKAKAKEAKYIIELNKIKNRNFARLDAMDPSQRAKFIKQKFKGNMNEIDKNRPHADDWTRKIQKEQDSWWPNNSDIMKWLDERQKVFRLMMERASELGLSDFNEKTVNNAKKIVEEQERKEAEMKRLAEELARHRKEMALKYGNKRIDLEALQKICKEQQDKQNAMNDSIQQLIDDISSKSNEYSDIIQAEIDGEEDEEERADTLDVAVV